MNTKSMSGTINRTLMAAVISAGAMMWADNVSAHVDYIILNPAGSSASAPMKRYGWIDGTDTDLGDSHVVTFFKFDLIQDSLVTITMTGQPGLDPAFTLYAGLLPDEAHDDTGVDPLNPVDGFFNPIASPVDNGVTTDSSGRVSPFRDTANHLFEGQFNALGSWSMANDIGEWSVIEYLTHKNDSTGDESLLGYFLPAGSYTIVAGGAACNNTLPSCISPSLFGTVTLSASPVPLPAAAYLFGTGLVSLVGLARRKMKASMVK